MGYLCAADPCFFFSCIDDANWCVMNGANTSSGSRGTFGGQVGVLLVHGLAGAPAEFRFVAQGLGRAGHTVFCPLLPGLAAGTDISERSSWKEWYTALEAAHDELKSRCDIILVGGMSAGAVLALRLARERHADVHGLILFSPTLWPNGWAIPRSFILFRLVMYKWFARLFHFRQRPPFGIKDERIRKAVVECVLKDQDRLGGGRLWEFKAIVDDVRRGLAMVNQPAHIFHAREDDQSDLGTAETIARSLGGPVELTILDDSYHLITFDRQRSVVVDRTVEFVFQITQRVLERRAMVESALAPAPSLSRPA